MRVLSAPSRLGTQAFPPKTPKAGPELEGDSREFGTRERGCEMLAQAEWRPLLPGSRRSRAGPVPPIPEFIPGLRPAGWRAAGIPRMGTPAR